MKLAKLKITKLYGLYDFDLVFNGNPTAIYGINGSGKTGILQLLGWFGSGKLENLLTLEFQEADFQILNDHITLKRSTDNSPKIHIYKNDKSMGTISSETVSDLTDFPNFRRKPRLSESVSELIQEVKKIMPTVYVPTSRSGAIIQRHRLSQNYFMEMAVNIPKNPLDQAIKQAESSFNAAQVFAIQQETRALGGLRSKLIEKIAEPLVLEQKQLLHMEDRLNVIVNHFGQFFDLSQTNLFEIDESQLRDYLRSQDTSKQLGAIAIIQQLERLRPIVEESIESINRIRVRIKKYLDVLNKYFQSTSKGFSIDPQTNYLVCRYHKHKTQRLKLEMLSSGEKELFFIITVASFGDNGRLRPALLVIDEPELSLHVKWQEMLLPSLKELNPDLQVIVATHSPEIAATAEPNLIEIGGSNKNE